MKNTYVNCKDWSWEDKLLYMKACIGGHLPNTKFCGYASSSKGELLAMYQSAHYIYCCDNGMIVYEKNTSTPKPGCGVEVKLADIKPQTKEVEWVNGDKCIYEGALYDYQCVSSWDENACVLSGASPDAKPFTDAWIDELSKPETEDELKERKELEAAYDLYCYAIDLETPFDKFCNFGPLKDIYIKIVRKTNYKVKGE